MASDNAQQELRNKATESTPFYTPVQDPPAGTAVTPQPSGKPMPKLFTPLQIRGMAMQNRIMVSPMCQYSAHEGFHTPWHSTHLGGIVQRGPGLTIIEATAVQANGRITPEDSGLWLDAHADRLRKHVDFAHSQGQKMAIQLSHAGRKASSVAPWLSRGAIASPSAGGWPKDVVAPSSVGYDAHHAAPRAMSMAEIEQFKSDFVAAARRAVGAGFDAIEIHGGHGYLLHQFVSPATNQRTDRYGGSFENRVRLPLEICEVVRAAIPADMPLLYRLSATDWLEEADQYQGPSWKLEDSVRFAPLLAEKGVDFLDVTTGGNHPQQKIRAGPGYQAPFAKEIKKAVGKKMFVGTVGAITTGPQAEELIRGDRDADDVPLDIVLVGRMFLKNPGLRPSTAGPRLCLRHTPMPKPSDSEHGGGATADGPQPARLINFAYTYAVQQDTLSASASKSFRMDTPLDEAKERARYSSEKLYFALWKAFPGLKQDFDTKWDKWKRVTSSFSSSASATLLVSPAAEFNAPVALGPKIIPFALYKVTLDYKDVAAVHLYNALEKDLAFRADPGITSTLNPLGLEILAHNFKRNRLVRNTIANWEERCERLQHHSNPLIFTECEEYKQLVEFGPSIIPHIMLAYKDSTGLLWYDLLHEIIWGHKTGLLSLVVKEEYAWWAGWFEKGDYKHVPHYDRLCSCADRQLEDSNDTEQN
ncbi:NADH-dependent flavin oxidoreductase [Collariella sp. IMI 366227]|nr:NADH-dependent flavin oxidoreductase [Collariella sp. IMI 366227]